MNIPEPRSLSNAAMTDEQREELIAELDELREGRLAARKDARSGNPAKRAQGQRAVAGITDLIRAGNRALREDEQ